MQRWGWKSLHTQNDSPDRLWRQSALINGPNQGCSGDHLCPIQVRTIRPTLEDHDRRERLSSHPSNEDNKNTIMAYLWGWHGKRSLAFQVI